MHAIVTYLISMTHIFPRWACAEEQGKFSAVASMGGTFGVVLIYPFVGYLLQQYNWEVIDYAGTCTCTKAKIKSSISQVVVYVSAVCSLAWCVVWLVFASDDPADNMFTSREEVEHIVKNRQTCRGNVSKVYRYKVLHMHILHISKCCRP